MEPNRVSVTQQDLFSSPCALFIAEAETVLYTDPIDVNKWMDVYIHLDQIFGLTAPLILLFQTS